MDIVDPLSVILDYYFVRSCNFGEQILEVTLDVVTGKENLTGGTVLYEEPKEELDLNNNVKEPNEVELVYYIVDNAPWWKNHPILMAIPKRCAVCGPTGNPLYTIDLITDFSPMKQGGDQAEP